MLLVKAAGLNFNFAKNAKSYPHAALDKLLELNWRVCVFVNRGLVNEIKQQADTYQPWHLT